jgi:hypothetical protein
MPKRRCVLTEEELEAFVLESEEEEAYRLKLERAVEDQREQHARGRESPALDKYIDQLRSTLAKLRAARRRIVLPNEHGAVPVSPKSQEVLRRRGIGRDADTRR